MKFTSNVHDAPDLSGTKPGVCDFIRDISLCMRKTKTKEGEKI